MILDKIKNSFKRNKKVIIYTGLFFFIFYFSGDLVFAGNNNKTYTEQDTINFIIGILNIALGIIAAVLGAVTALVSWFLTPEWYNGKIFGLDGTFKDLWILVSNLVYFAFAIVLIVIAFMNIVGGKGDNWELKQALPRFVVGVLIVPVSRFLVQFLLSLSAILTVSVLTLPIEVINNSTDGKLDIGKVKKMKIYSIYELKLGSSKEGKCKEGDNEDNIEGAIMRRCGDEITVKKILEGTEEGAGEGGLKNSIFAITALYTYGVMSIDANEIRNRFVNGDGTVIASIKTIGDLLQKGLFDAILAIVYSVLMIALFLALFVRGVMLWIYTIFSPAFGLTFFFGKASEGVGDGNMKFSVKELIALAMVPVYVSMALAFGFIFISAVVVKVPEKGQDNCIGFGGNMEFCISGAIGDTGVELMNTGKSGLGRLIIKIFGIVVLWIGVFAALRKSDITKSIVEPIETFGKQVGGLVMKSPMYAPIIPTGDGDEKMGALGLLSAGNTVVSKIKAIPQTKGQTFAQEHFGGLFSGKAKEYGNFLNKITAIPEGSKDELVKAIKEGFKIGTVEQFAKDIAARKGLVAALEKLGVNDSNLLKNIREANNPSAFRQALIEANKKLDKDHRIIGTTQISGEVDKYFGTSGSSSGDSKDDKTTTKTDISLIPDEVEKETDKNGKEIKVYHYLNSNIEMVESGNFREFKDREEEIKDIAQDLVSNGLIGNISKKEIKQALTKMGIATDKQEEIIKGILGKIEKKVDGGYSYNPTGVKDKAKVSQSEAFTDVDKPKAKENN